MYAITTGGALLCAFIIYIIYLIDNRIKKRRFTASQIKAIALLAAIGIVNFLVRLLIEYFTKTSN